jgi:hypothetical protein
VSLWERVDKVAAVHADNRNAWLREVIERALKEG